ncbi:type IX secretion system protein PorG [Adhaeribacter radiodurans]|uniref:Porin family protein n=1 Tax=Adhaeribacter radiodurans TaxID=2745197 RepID=A0A7L7L2H7_9BACT|nr:DUF6089 family protein [Adhaeribacter radiodurans]QMU26994.1 porin family protein [Adhaeribacter radiodurans]
MFNLSVRTTLLISLWLVRSLFFANELHAQNTSEIGGGIGGLVYKGEVAPNYRFQNNRPGVVLFYKKDISKPVTLKAHLMAGMLRAQDKDAELPVNTFRQANFKTNLVELSAGLEYNFLDYYNQKRRTRWTPYYFISFAAARFSNKVVLEDKYTKPTESATVLSIPTGIGFKYALSYNWNLGLEVGARKIIAKNGDHLDYLQKKDYPELPYQELLLTDPYDNDWYFYNGISISYTFYKLLCPPATKSKAVKHKKLFFN